MKYRSDIDGLRALAVLPVLFYHGGMTFFSGGYVGVDIFFVISGYLITSVIIEEIKNNTFTIKNFHVRRIKRIFPVLFFILLTVTVLGLFLQMPYDFRNYGKSLSATVMFVSNIYFNKQMGYFTDAAEAKPLLHTWSLSVEEQFYIFYPLILILITRYLDRKYIRYVFGIFLVSLIASIVMIDKSPSDTFYLLHTRAWELFIGSLLALGAMPALRNRVLSEVLSIGGLAMILYSIVVYTSETQFPGAAAILPCVGAFLLIYTGGQSTAVSKVLSMRPFVYVGLISYSLYLWHWPLLSFFNSYRPIILISDGTADTVRYALLALSFLLSVLTYRYIETPFRKIRPKNLKVFFSKTFAVMAVICLLGGVVYWTDGIPWRMPKTVYQIDNGHDELEKMGSCKDRNTSEFNYESIRRIGADGGEPEFVIFGDSHAGAFYPGFDAYGKKTGRTGLLVSKNGLVPVLGFGHKYKDCYTDIAEKTVEIINSHENIKRVVLISRWVIHVEGHKGSKNRVGKEIIVYDQNHNVVPRGEVHGYIYENLRRTVETLQKHGKEVFIMSGVPEIDENVPDVMAKTEFLNKVFGYGNVVDIRPTVKDFEDYQKNVHMILKKVSDDTGATILHPEEALRNGKYYELTHNGHSNYMDGNHLNSFGAVFIVEALGPLVFGD